MSTWGSAVVWWRRHWSLVCMLVMLSLLMHDVPAEWLQMSDSPPHELSMIKVFSVSAVQTGYVSWSYPLHCREGTSEKRWCKCSPALVCCFITHWNITMTTSLWDKQLCEGLWPSAPSLNSSQARLCSNCNKSFIINKAHGSLCVAFRWNILGLNGWKPSLGGWVSMWLDRTCSAGGNALEYLNYFSNVMSILTHFIKH